MVWPGTRTSVVMWTGPGTTRMFYTWNQWAASLCERAYQKKQAITVDYDETAWGNKIVSVELVKDATVPA